MPFEQPFPSTDWQARFRPASFLHVPECDISNGGTLQAVKLADGTNSTVLKAQ